MGGYPFVLYVAGPEDFDEVAGLVREAAGWLGGRDTDQWQKPWPDQAGHEERIRNDLRERRTRLLRDGETIVATITIDTEENRVEKDRPVWPLDKNPKPAVYIRRVVVSRRYGGLELGAALLDWAAAKAEKDYQAELMRIDVWTTNKALHNYYEGQRFTRCQDPKGLGDYPSQALFERSVHEPRSDFFRLLSEEN
jgi:ribosomal protein S18 acetylase RimI-like enzyme